MLKGIILQKIWCFMNCIEIPNTHIINEQSKFGAPML